MTPRNQEKVFRKEYALVLLKLAKADLHSAKILLNDGTSRPEIIAFLTHQAIEKSLKAVLVALAAPVPLVHDPGILVAKFPQNITPPKGYDLSELTPFATVKRYEEGESLLTVPEAEAMFKVGSKVVEWSEIEIKKALKLG